MQNYGRMQNANTCSDEFHRTVIEAADTNGNVSPRTHSKPEQTLLFDRYAQELIGGTRK